MLEDMARPRLLLPANLVLVALLLVHVLDHELRQTASVPDAAGAAGLAGFAAALLALGLTAARSRLAAPATALVGFATAAGFLAVHVLPDWGPFSQPYPDIDVDAASWAAMLVPAAAAAAAGAIGLSRLRDEA
jgi:hypothetical protein